MNFTLSRSAYADIMSTIKDGISSLESLTTTNIELEPPRRLRSRVKLLSVLRGVSSSIYRAIRSSLTCTCKHDISLRLSSSHGEITPADDLERVIQSIKFHLALSQSFGGEDPEADSVKPQSWEEVLIQANPIPKISHVHSHAVSACIAKPTGRKRMTVSFATRSSSSCTTLVETPTTTSLATSLSTSLSGLTLQAKSRSFSGSDSCLKLCEELKRFLAHGKSLDIFGTIIDRPSLNPRSYNIFLPSILSFENPSPLQMVSLRDVLEGQGDLQPPTYKERLHLASAIALSVLQLHNSPWMPPALGSRNVFFLKRGDSVYYDHAFVMADSPPSQAWAKPSCIIRSPALLALGILLIELIRGQTIDSLRTPKEMLDPESSVLADYMTAERLVHDIYQSSSNYASAVRRCINQQFKTPDLNLEDDDFCQEVYAGVVALLEEDLSYTR